MMDEPKRPSTTRRAFFGKMAGASAIVIAAEMKLAISIGEEVPVVEASAPLNTEAVYAWIGQTVRVAGFESILSTNRTP